MNRNLKKWFIPFIIILLIGVYNIEVSAAEGQVYFGSSQYSIQQGETFPIGVYVKSALNIGSYSLTIYYDSSMLEHISGGTPVEEGVLYLDGVGNVANYQHMLSFQTLQSGDTIITIEQASGLSSSDTMEELTFNTPLSVPVSIISPVIDTSLKTLQIKGYESSVNFEPNVFNYRLNVPNNIEYLDIIAEPLDPNVEILVSDTTLNPGENIIQIQVLGVDTEPTVYEITVIKEAPLLPSEDVIQENKENNVDNNLELDDTTEIKQDFSNKVELVEVTGLNKLKVYIKNWLLLDEEINIQFLSGLLITIIFFLIISRVTKYKSYLLHKKKKKQLLNEPMHIIDLDKDDIETIEEPYEIKLENVSMKFRMAQDEASSLKEFIIKNIKGRYQYRYLTALNKVTFSVQKGDIVGIIGTNGSGKSTLLKIISGALSPTEGNVYVEHEKVQLLTLGTGFDMELTAKENVYLNGAIIGYKKEYIDERYEEIVNFAELNGFMEERMKNFSSGMVSRLGFAIATLRESPEILILDEVLTVGDMFFRKKSEERIKSMIHSGGTVLIVAHSMETIMKTCNKAIWIEKGLMQMEGNPKEVCDAYARMDKSKKQ